MGKTLKDHLLAALYELTDEELKRFKRKLNDVEVESDYERIPRGMLDKADRMDVAVLVVKYYTVDYGILVVLRVLDEINQKDVSNELRKKIKAEGGTSGSTAPPQIASEGGSAVSSSPAAGTSKTSTEGGAAAIPNPAGGELVELQEEAGLSLPQTAIVAPLLRDSATDTEKADLK